MSESLKSPQTLRDAQLRWQSHRSSLQAEARVLVVDGDPEFCVALQDTLGEQNIPVHAVGSAEQVLESVGKQPYAVVAIGERLPGMDGIKLARQLRRSLPYVEVVMTAADPTLALLVQAFELRLEVLPRPQAEMTWAGEHIDRILQRHIDSLMRNYVLDQLRELLEHSVSRVETTQSLDRRLSAFKRTLGARPRALVVEGDPHLRRISERLLDAGVHVQVASSRADAQQGLLQGGFSLMLWPRQTDERTSRIATELRAIDPYTELAIVDTDPDAGQAWEALRSGVAYYTPWPVASSVALVAQLSHLLNRSRRDRLLDNLFVELFRESHELYRDGGTTVESAPAEAFSNFREAIGLRRLPPDTDIDFDTDLGGSQEELSGLRGVLSDIASPPDPAPDSAEDLPTDDSDPSERRLHLRVPDNQYVRFRRENSPTATISHLGDLSEGGIFIRTAVMPSPKTNVELDITVLHRSKRFRVVCQGEVAWVTYQRKNAPLGQGFGVRLIDPPPEIADLLKRVVGERTGEISTEGVVESEH